MLSLPADSLSGGLDTLEDLLGVAVVGGGGVAEAWSALVSRWA